MKIAGDSDEPDGREEEYLELLSSTQEMIDNHFSATGWETVKEDGDTRV